MKDAYSYYIEPFENFDQVIAWESPADAPMTSPQNHQEPLSGNKQKAGVTAHSFARPDHDADHVNGISGKRGPDGDVWIVSECFHVESR